jgi:uncharacterized protein
MRILISIQHPAWAHQFRYVIKELEKKGHTVKVLAINKDRDLELLNAFGIRYESISNTSGKNIIGKALIFVNTTLKISRISRKFKPDMYIGRASPMMAINSFLFRKPHIVFADTELSKFSLFISKLFSDVIITPNCFKIKLGKKHLKINAFKEMFYLHPNYFQPDPSVLSESGLSPEDKFIILRFVSWQAHHDIGQKGLDIEAKRKAVKELSVYGKILISSESPLPDEFEAYRITIPPEKIHHLLYYATLFLGDSQTMTSEAALLGTPAIRSNSFVGPDDMGNFKELENKYDIIYSFQKADLAIEKALELLQMPNLKSIWKNKQKRLFADQIDATGFMINFIETYPDSLKKYINSRNIQD